MSKNDPAIVDHVKHIHSEKVDYAHKIKELQEMSRLGPRPPVLVTDHPRLFKALRGLELDSVQLKDRGYATIKAALSDAYDEYRDPRMVLLGLPPLRWGSRIETFHPLADIDEDGYIELVVASLPARIDLLTDHLLQAAQAFRRSELGEVHLVSQNDRGQVWEYLAHRRVHPIHQPHITALNELGQAELILQISDGEDRIHGTPDRWVDRRGEVLSGPWLRDQVAAGFRFQNYPLVFSEACECGRYDGSLTKGFQEALAVYMGNSISTSNNLVAGQWYELLCGDGFKYGLLTKLRGQASIFEIYREVVNLLVQNAPQEEKRILEQLLANEKRLITSDAIQILTFNLFGLDRPSPLQMI